MSFNPVYGPYSVEIKVHIIDDEKEKRGKATIGMGNGSMPTEKEVAERIKKFATVELPELAPGYRLQTASELWDSICFDEVGQTFSVPAAFREFKQV